MDKMMWGLGRPGKPCELLAGAPHTLIASANATRLVRLNVNKSPMFRPYTVSDILRSHEIHVGDVLFRRFEGRGGGIPWWQERRMKVLWIGERVTVLGTESRSNTSPAWKPRGELAITDDWPDDFPWTVQKANVPDETREHKTL
jgi:hypothetical protein